MTKEQAVFYKLLKEIKTLEEQEPKDEEELKEQKKKINEDKTLLWAHIYKFAKSEINALMGDFSTQEEREDALQSVALIFFEKLYGILDYLFRSS